MGISVRLLERLLNLKPSILSRQALAILRRFGTNAHAYIPGIGTISGLTAGNYLLADGSTGLTPTDGLQGLVLDAAGSVGPLLKGAVAPIASTTGFSSGQATLSLVSNEIVFTQTAGVYAQVVVSPPLVAEIGKTYRVEATFRRGTHTAIQMQVQRGAAGSYAVIVATSMLTNTTNVTKELYFTATATDTVISVTSVGVPGDTSYVASFTVQEVTGIHATSSGAARPTLRLTSGRYSSQYAGAQSLTLGSVPFQMSDDHFVIAAGRIDNGAVPTQTLFGCANSSTANPLVGQLSFNLTGVTGNMRDNAGTLIAAGTGTLAIGETFVGSLIRTTGSVLVRKNGVSGTPVSTTGLGATTLTTATIGASTRTTVVSAVTGAVGPVIIGKGTLTAAEALTLERFVASLTPSAPSF